MFTLYGIANCDKIKTAKRWLDQQQVDYHFHDYRRAGIPDQVPEWLAQIGWQALINRRSTSWRQLSDEQRNRLDNEKALLLITATPTLIKRPLLVANQVLLVGFDEQRWLAAIQA